jgi:replication initiator protein RepSA
MTEPMVVGELLPGVLQEVIERAGPGYDRWAEQVAATGYCAHPVRLRGRVEHADPATGEVRTAYLTDREPDATLLKACGNRRASVCPSCSATYQADSFQLLAAGLRGGKGVPGRVVRHPRLFVTFTAPSFGPVHTRKAQGLFVYPCHPYRQGATCPHGKRAGCWQRHDGDDPRLGEPLCVRCYQAGAQVLWNALAGRLWSRTTIYLYRTLAKAAGMSEADLRRVVRISFAKVAEYQKRGAVHFHAVIRLDARTACGCPVCVLPPPEEFTAGLLEEAVKDAAATVAVACPPVEEDQDVTLTARWGEQLHVRHITGDDGQDDKKLLADQVAGYVAKYATKSTEALGVTLDHRICEVELESLDLPAHVTELVRACWELGGRPALVGLRLRKWAHMLGFGGHFSSKSRRYSTTLGALRQARVAYAIRRRHGDTLPLDAWGRPADDQAVIVVATWSYIGSGYQTTGEAWLAASAAARAREARRIAKEELRTMTMTAA